jgi:hypothetical protein
VESLREWLKLYLRSELARIPRKAPPAQLPEAGRAWTDILRELICEVPLLAHEPNDPKTLIGSRLRKYFPHGPRGAAWWTAHIVKYQDKRKDPYLVRGSRCS